MKLKNMTMLVKTNQRLLLIIKTCFYFEQRYNQEECVSKQTRKQKFRRWRKKKFSNHFEMLFVTTK
jgi:hypothetical protein